jgi:hypothetical protein
MWKCQPRVPESSHLPKQRRAWACRWAGRRSNGYASGSNQFKTSRRVRHERVQQASGNQHWLRLPGSLCPRTSKRATSAQQAIGDIRQTPVGAHRPRCPLQCTRQPKPGGNRHRGAFGTVALPIVHLPRCVYSVEQATCVKSDKYAGQVRQAYTRATSTRLAVGDIRQHARRGTQTQMSTPVIAAEETSVARSAKLSLSHCHFNEHDAPY